MTPEERTILEHVILGIRHARRLADNGMVDHRDKIREELALAQGRLEGLLETIELEAHTGERES